MENERDLAQEKYSFLLKEQELRQEDLNELEIIISETEFQLRTLDETSKADISKLEEVIE